MLKDCVQQVLVLLLEQLGDCCCRWSFLDTREEGFQGFVGWELEVDLLVLDLLLVFLVNLRHSLFHRSPKLIFQLILEGAHFQLDTCQVDYILKLLE